MYHSILNVWDSIQFKYVTGIFLSVFRDIIFKKKNILICHRKTAHVVIVIVIVIDVSVVPTISID